MTINPRKIAFDVLIRFEKGGSSSRLKADSLLMERLAGADISAQDRGFTHALVMGVLRHWFRLDAWIKELSGRKLKDLQPAVRVLLRMGLFQLYGLHQVPMYAAIDTTVTLAKTQKQNPKAVQFINALLREAQRNLEADGFIVPEFGTEPTRHLLLENGWPEALSAELLKTYPAFDVQAMAQASQNPALLALRVNTLKTTVENVKQAFSEKGISTESVSDELPEALLLKEFSGSVQALPGYQEGWFYVQDSASMQVAKILNSQPEEHVLDLCAAPGSKTTHMAALMHNTGNITAIEPKPQRLKLLEENLERLGVTNVKMVLFDAMKWDSETLYDKVLVDAPCSGSGTLRRHPEILLHLKKMDISEYPILQMQLLEKGFTCLKSGGVLVYSTCSILPAENRDVVQVFLKLHPEARLEYEQQSLITPISDGFYTARIIKK